MAVRKLKEELDFDRCFTDVCKVYVNGKELDISGLDTYDQVGDVFAAECRRTPELEGWIREYMNSLGDPVVDDTYPVEVVCRLFAQELDMDLHDSEPGEFYVDGSGSVFDSDVRVEIFEESVKRGRNSVGVKRIRERLVNGKIRELIPQYDSRQSFYGKAQVATESDGTETLYSYKTPVVRIVDGEVELLPLWDSSATTLRHVKEFLKQSGFEAGTKQSIARAYKAVSESKTSTRRAKRVNEDFDDKYDDADFTDAYAGYPGLQDAIDAMYRLNETLAKFSNAVDEMCKGSEYELFSGSDDAMAFADGANEIYKVLGELEDKFENLPGTPYIY